MRVDRESKKRLISERGWEDKCMVMGCPNPLPMWNGKPITLQLDHINGVGDDNRIENLRVICPNCHSQTDTFGNRNPNRQPQRFYCSGCGGTKGRYALLCKGCGSGRKGNFKIEWPEDNAIIKMIESKGYVGAAKELGVSDKAVSKRMFIRCGYKKKFKGACHASLSVL